MLVVEWAVGAKLSISDSVFIVSSGNCGMDASRGLGAGTRNATWVMSSVARDTDRERVKLMLAEEVLAKFCCGVSYSLSEGLGRERLGSGT